MAHAAAPFKKTCGFGRFSLYYYFVFGSFLALILWLPSYYMSAYQQNFQQAMGFTLFFVTTSSMVRALGGWLADRYGGQLVNWSVFWVCFGVSIFPELSTNHHDDSWPRARRRPIGWKLIFGYLPR